jgi:hypothetical protein
LWIISLAMCIPIRLQNYCLLVGKWFKRVKHGNHFGHFKRCSKESPAGRVWKIQALPAGDSFLTVPFCYFSLVGGFLWRSALIPSWSHNHDRITVLEKYWWRSPGSSIQTRLNSIPGAFIFKCHFETVLQNFSGYAPVSLNLAPPCTLCFPARSTYLRTTPAEDRPSFCFLFLVSFLNSLEIHGLSRCPQ